MYERTYKNKVLSSQTPPPQRKRRRRLSLKKLLWTIAAVAFVAAVVVLIRLPGLQVRTVEVTGTSVTDPEEVILFVRSQLEGTALYLFPRSSMLIVPTATISKKLEMQFPRFADAQVRRKGLHGLSVAVAEREGALLWCERDDACFFMTAEGVVFAEAPFFSGNAYEKVFYGERRELPFAPLPENALSFIQLMHERLPSIGIVPREYRFVSDHQTDIVFSHQGTPARLMVDPSNDLEKTIKDLATGLATEPLKTQFAAQTKVLEYLDARFANKVVYKFK